MLNINVFGEPTNGPSLLIAHGLFGSARNWGAIGKRLSADRQVMVVDMRNHGDSPHDTDHSYGAMAADLAEVIEGEGGCADVLGHSMGGKAAMMLALTAPERVNRLIVADIAPVTYSHSQLPYIEAMKSVDLSRVERRSDADAQLRETVDEAALRAFFLQSLKIDDQGVAWKLNLAALEDQMPSIIGFPSVAGSYGGEVLFLTGGASDYVTREHRPGIRRLFPKARFEAVAGAGHWLHAEAPKPFIAAVKAFLV